MSITIPGSTDTCLPGNHSLIATIVVDYIWLESSKHLFGSNVLSGVSCAKICCCNTSCTKRSRNYFYLILKCIDLRVIASEQVFPRLYVFAFWFQLGIASDSSCAIHVRTGELATWIKVNIHELRSDELTVWK